MLICRLRAVLSEQARYEKMMRDSPEFQPLVHCSSYQVLSALKVGERKWQCRVRVDNQVGATRYSVEYNWELMLQSSASIEYDLGQCVKHTGYGYDGVVVGWDHECRQSDDWPGWKFVDGLPKGRHQPFYHVLVDQRDRDRPGKQMAYVAQENIVGTDRRQIVHPFLQASFTGAVDKETGFWEPHPMLRDQYPVDIGGCWLVDRVTSDRDESSFEA